jgi:hypothetical protein
MMLSAIAEHNGFEYNPLSELFSRDGQLVLGRPLRAEESEASLQRQRMIHTQSFTYVDFDWIEPVIDLV